MIRIKSAKQAEDFRDKLPEVVITTMKQFEGDDDVYDPDIFGYLIWIEPGDDIGDIPEVADNGLLSIITDEWFGFELVERHIEDNRSIFEMVVAIDADKVIALFVEDAPWLDQRVRSMIEDELNNRTH